MLSSLRRGPVLLIVAAIALFAVGGTVFTEANTMTDTTIQAGRSIATVSGFSIDNIVYNLNATDPDLIDSVTFDADNDTGANGPANLANMLVEFDDTTGHYVCTNAAPTLGVYPVTCDTDSAAANFWETGAAGADLAVVDVDAFNIVIIE